MKIMAKIKKGKSAYDAALDYLTPKDRTQREIEIYLDGENYSEIEIINTVERLKNSGLIDDARYAENFIESRLNTKPVSKRRLMQQLEEHFIGQDIVADALTRIDEGMEYDNARRVDDKFYRQFSKLEEEERLKRVGLRLSARGYDYDCIKQIIGMLRERGELDND